MRQALHSGSLATMALIFVLASTQTSIGQVASQADSAVQQAPSQTEQLAETASLHDKLAKYLSGTKWTGQFTVDGEDKPKTERYEILSAEKNEVGDFWNLVTRIKYGDHDQTLPLPPIEIKFADKTPVITIDKVRFPGFGTFDARVLIRQGKYAGTWAHSGGKGGHLFGTIEPMDPEVVKEKMKNLEK